MLPGKNRRRNTGSARADKPTIGGRNISPREPFVLPDQFDDDMAGEDYYDCEWEGTNTVARVGEDDDDDADDLSEAVARIRARREEARLAATRNRSEQDGVTAIDHELDESGRDGTEESDDRARAVHEPVTALQPLTAEEARWRRKRDERIWKRLRDSDKTRLRKGTDVTRESCYVVVCAGAGKRVGRERTMDEYEEVYHSGVANEAFQERRDTLRQRGEQVAAYNSWVAENRPELADEKLLNLLAGSKEERADAKTRLAELDKKYRVIETGKAATTGSMPLIYQKEYQGKVRACPEWVTRVVKAVARKHAHHIPAMVSVLAQLAYWMRPKTESGEPRATRAKLINGKWWIVLGYRTIEKQTSVSISQARAVIRYLRELNLIETLTAEETGVETEVGGVNFGPNTVFLRVNTEALDPLVQKVMTVNLKSGFGNYTGQNGKTEPARNSKVNGDRTAPKQFE